jgi:hypothetical protein
MSKAEEKPEDQGTCTHPDCTWSGQRRAYKKHKSGAGIPPKRIKGKHEDCKCCCFRLAAEEAAAAPASVLRKTLGCIEQVNA